jgi:hypothetical protein
MNSEEAQEASKEAVQASQDAHDWETHKLALCAHATARDCWMTWKSREAKEVALEHQHQAYQHLLEL